jgi:hypothetical protein
VKPKGVTLGEATRELRRQEKLLRKNARPVPPPRIVGRAGDVFGGLFFPQPFDEAAKEEVDRGVFTAGEPSRAGVVEAGCDELPPPPPSQPSFTRFLSAEGFARWLKRSELNDDPRLRAHCAAVRRAWRPIGSVPDVSWPFPTFVPRARPFDWTVDA